MGLRFRKSVTLCKGVKLNFSKTGTSLTLGSKGYHKTISSKGRVTTTIGLPGTGVYWTETKKIGGNRTNGRYSYDGTNRYVPMAPLNEDERASNMIYSEHNSSEPNDDFGEEAIEIENSYGQSLRKQRREEKPYLEDFFSNIKPIASNNEQEYHLQQDDKDIDDSANDLDSLEAKGNIGALEQEDLSETEICREDLSMEQIHKIYYLCDEEIEWDEIQAGTSFSDLFMGKEKWDLCRKLAARIVHGDVDAYLEAIETFRPVDDLLLFCGDFEFGTDRGNYIEIEFRITTDYYENSNNNNPLFDEYVYAICIRVARDTMALLPVSNVILHAVYDSKTILSVLFDKNTIVTLDYRNKTAKELIKAFKSNSGLESDVLHEVQRLLL